MAKFSRNEPCPCDSGKKYKRCCLNAESGSALSESVKQRPVLLKTVTDEFFQPTRLYYAVYDAEQLKTRLQHLKCIGNGDSLEEYLLFYEDEAAKIPLGVSPHKIPKEMQPLVIASFYLQDAETFWIDVRSIERAARIIEFLDRHVSRKVMKITHAAIYNQLISAQDRSSVRDVDYDEIFNPSNMTVIDPSKNLEEIKSVAAQCEDKKQAMEEFFEKTWDEAKKPLPLAEKFPVHFYEDGIDSFEFACQLRQAIAMKRFSGKEDYSLYDLIQEFAMAEEPMLES